MAFGVLRILHFSCCLAFLAWAPISAEAYPEGVDVEVNQAFPDKKIARELRSKLNLDRMPLGCGAVEYKNHSIHTLRVIRRNCARDMEKMVSVHNIAENFVSEFCELQITPPFAATDMAFMCGGYLDDLITEASQRYSRSRSTRLLIRELMSRCEMRISRYFKC